MVYKKIKTFKDLETWKGAHNLVLLIYKNTSIFPKSESYSLVDQMRRAAVSVSSNIAEGFTRTTKKEKVRFYNIAIGSLVELQNQVQIAKDLKYIDLDNSNKVESQIDLTTHLVYGMIRSSRTK